MNHDLIIQELKAVLKQQEAMHKEVWGENAKQNPNTSISRLRFVIATLEAKENDTVRLKCSP